MAQIRTLADLKSVIADDLQRTDLTSAISQAIEDAVQHYQSERFWFNQSRTVEFSTVDTQEIYTASDDAEIPTFVSVDHVWSIDSGGEIMELFPIPIGEWEQLSDNSASTGEPYWYVYYNNAFYLYPTPNATVHTIRVTGQQGAIIDPNGNNSAGIGAPDNDSEVNPYIENAFELLRCHAKMLLYAHKIQAPDMASLMEGRAERALMALRREAGKRAGPDIIASTCF